MTPPDREDGLDDVWRALGNSFRRTLLDALRDHGPLTTGTLAEAVSENRFVVMQHLKVLREAGLVVVEERGRTSVNHLNTVPIERITQRWISGYAGNWASALVGLKSEVESTQAQARMELRTPARRRRVRS